MVLLDKVAEKDRPVADEMLNGELARQRRLKAEISKSPEAEDWLDEHKVMQNYKALQFIDTLTLYFHRIHPSERGEQLFEHVPVSRDKDVSIAIRPAGDNRYALSPFPFAAEGAEFAFSGRRISPSDGQRPGGWPAALREIPTEMESFKLVAG
jgi:hypothetical protein